MKNLEVAGVLNEIAEYLEFSPDAKDKFKIRAYRKAALVIGGLSEDVGHVWKEKRLEELPSIGEGIAKKINEFLETGSLKYLEELKKKTPVDVENLGKVGGVGPKTIMKLYKHLRIKTIPEMEKAASQGKIQKIKGLGPVVEQNILRSIEFAAKTRRIPLGLALSSVEEMLEAMKECKDVQRISIAGSVRRMKETIGDIDILATSKAPEKVVEFFSTMGNVAYVLAKGPTKSSIRLRQGIQVDLRILDDNIFGAALLYFTGSKEHNILLRRIAIEKGLKLSEYGLFGKKSNKTVGGKTEGDIYNKLGMDYIEPEMREDEGEIELAQHHMLPKLLNYNEIKGDLQMHTKWSDGSNSIEEMAAAAKKLGHQYICITDHSGNLTIANALDEKRINEQKKEIEKLNKNLNGIVVLQGTEVNITDEGRPDVSDKILKEMDVVVASIHSGFKNGKEKLTSRMISAMHNDNVDIIAHPTGRLLGRRDAYELDFDKVFDAAKNTKTVMEINCDPYRMDLKDVNARAAVKAGVRLAISTDSHSAEQMKFMKLGIGIARRGWATRDDIINTRNLKDMLRMLKH